MSVHICMQYPWRPEEVSRSSGTWFFCALGTGNLVQGLCNSCKCWHLATSWQPPFLVLLKEESAMLGEKEAKFPLAFVNFLL